MNRNTLRISQPPRRSPSPGWGQQIDQLEALPQRSDPRHLDSSRGHFAILATGVDNLTIDNVKIDTNRDGIDIDACRNVRVSNCSVNSPFDDGICPKSSFGWAYARATEM